MPLTAEQIMLLQQPLDPKHVKKPTGNFGPKGDYIEGWHAINELNRVFGFDGWSYTINMHRDALDKAEGKDQWQAAYTCICTLSAAGVTRQDVGFGSGFAKQIGDAIEGATKEAATDALKRAARTFGNIFGLALYDKTRANVGEIHPEPQGMPDAEWAKLASLLKATGVAPAKLLKEYGVENLRLISMDQYLDAVQRLNEVLAKKAKAETDAKAKQHAPADDFSDLDVSF